jgi:TPR repeat protein
MEPNHERSIIPLPDFRIEKWVSEKSRVVAAMVNETLLIANGTPTLSIPKSPNAQYIRGLFCQLGLGEPPNYIEAAKWNRLAAEQGHAGAQNNLGVCYYEGHGITQDYLEAAKWFRRAAEQGDSAGQFSFGLCCYYGNGAPQDLVEAVNWFRKAAAQGHVKGQYNLGCCYRDGRGVQQDNKEAANWFGKAAEQGHGGGQNNLGFLYQHGFGVRQDNEEAFRWYKRAAEGGLGWGKDSIAKCYRDGVAVAKNVFQAYKWFQLAADEGVEIARKEADRLAALMNLSEYKQAYALYREASNREQPAIPDSLPGADADLTSKRRAYFYHLNCAERELGLERRPLFWLHAKMCDSIFKELSGNEAESLPLTKLPFDLAERNADEP